MKRNPHKIRLTINSIVAILVVTIVVALLEAQRSGTNIV
jgi:hypothetical protein